MNMEFTSRNKMQACFSDGCRWIDLAIWANVFKGLGLCFAISSASRREKEDPCFSTGSGNLP